MKVEILIENDNTAEIVFKENYEVQSRNEFIEFVCEIEEIKDNIEADIDEYCTITLNFNWDEAEELEITEEDCG